MDAFPKLKILVCHGGGYLPYYNGRADISYIDNAGARGKARRKPSEYFRRFYYDTAFYDPMMLEHLLEIESHRWALAAIMRLQRHDHSALRDFAR